MAQQVKSLALSLPWLGSGSYCGANSIPGLGTFICRGDGQKKNGNEDMCGGKAQGSCYTQP